MALVINDRVKETSSTTGTGALTFAGAVSGFETFSAGIGNSNTTYYAVVNTATPTEWEVGLGTLAGDSSTITRTAVISSSNSDSAVDFGAGTKEIFCTLPASKAVIKDASGNVSPGGVITGTTVEATGDTSSGDNAAIGYTSAEGLILTGQGSTNDVTIKNDADTDVISIPTGATGVTLAGTLGSGAITSTAGITGTQVDITAQGDLRLQDSTGGEYIAQQAAATTTSYTVTWPGAVATANGQALKSTTGGVLSWGTAGTAWVGPKTSAYTAAAGEGVLCDTATTAAFTVTLPASPTLGDEVSIIDFVGNAGTANITVGRNSEKIQGASADLTISTDSAGIKLVYTNSANGWRLAIND